jgi:mRNA-degrading endonuclease RelE of RelBE toxin-antitoxin system
MNYTVVWKPDAENELVDLWTKTDDRRELAAAADRLEQALASHPVRIGEAAHGITRIAFGGPIGVVYDVSEPDRLVTVLQLLVHE